MKTLLLSSYKPEQVDTLLRCRDNVLFFGSLMAPMLTERQEQWLTNPQRMITLGDNHGTGRTTTMIVYGLWKMFLPEPSTVLYVSYPSVCLKETRNDVTAFMKRLPKYLMPKVTYNRHDMIQFETGSKMTFVSSAKGADHHWKLDVALLDNFNSSIPGMKEILNKMETAVPAKGKVLIAG